MGKKKKIDSEDTIETVSTRSVIESKFGKGVMISGSQILETQKMIIPVGPSLDIGLNGGIPEGSCVVSFGKQKVGKTTTMMHFAANCQKEEFGSRTVYYMDVEGRLKKMNLQGIAHLDVDRVQRIGSYVDEDGVSHILSAEDFLNIGINVLKTDPGCVLIIDSVAALNTMAQLSGEIGDSTRRAAVAGLLSEFYTAIAQIVPTNKNIVIAISQIQSNPSGRGKESRHKGGNAMMFQADVILEFLYAEAKRFNDADAKAFGQIAHVNVVTSALGAPFGKVACHIRFGKGIDEEAELLELGRQTGIINGTGWYTYVTDAGEEIKRQGENKFVSMLTERRDVFDEINTKVKGLLIG